MAEVHPVVAVVAVHTHLVVHRAVVVEQGHLLLHPQVVLRGRHLVAAVLDHHSMVTGQ
jgi:hypothetical protein